MNILGGLRKIKQGIWQYFGFLKNTVTFIYRLILITPPLQWWEIIPAALIGILVTWIVPMVKAKTDGISEAHFGVSFIMTNL